MAWVKSGWGGNGVFIEPHQTDLNCFRAIKTRQDTSCSNCGKKLPSRSWVYGSDWTRLCLNCGEKFLDTGIKEFKLIIDMININKKELKKNKDKWTAENTLALL
jgi:hypothetical protein